MRADGQTTHARSTFQETDSAGAPDSLDLLLRRLAGSSPLSAAEPTSSKRAKVSRLSPIEALIDARQGRLPEGELEDLEDSLANDPLLQELAAFSLTGELEDPDPLAPPARVLEKIYPMMKEPLSPKALWTMAVRFVQQGLELVSNTGELMALRPMAVRSSGAQTSEPSDRISVRQSLERFDAVLTIERSGEQRATTSLELREQGQPTRTDFEIELWQEQSLRGVRSGDNGAVSFSGLRPGHYRLVLQLEGASRGQLEFDLSV